MNIKTYQIESVINALQRLQSAQNHNAARFFGRKKKRKFDRNAFAYERAIEMLKEYETLIIVSEHRIIPALQYSIAYQDYVHEKHPVLHNEAIGNSTIHLFIRTAYRKIHTIIFGHETFPTPDTTSKT